MDTLLKNALLMVALLSPFSVIALPPTQLERLNQDVYGVEVTYREYSAAIARDYGIDPGMFIRVIECESGFNPNAVNPNEKHTDGTTESVGMLQFNRNTFTWMAGEAGIKDPDPFNVEHAVTAAAWGIANGHGRHWTCYRKLYE